MKKCSNCSGNVVEADDIINELDGHSFVVKGRRCTQCGEEFIEELEGQRMIQVARKLGIWGKILKLHRKLSKSGRGTVLRIPSDIEQEMSLTGKECVAISKVGKNKILIEVEQAH
ncbi:MAG: YgiT-type zinc finger protein [Candidatus Woesearchaeota archaeon]|nr:YgiT-type zinc finger protein [Candidatus Woesearchaeota archaeon]